MREAIYTCEDVNVSIYILNNYTGINATFQLTTISIFAVSLFRVRRFWQSPKIHES